MTLRVWLVASIALAVGGCDFAPRYSAPAVSLPAKFRDQRADGVDLSANEEWWRSFNDRTLDDLQAQVDAANPNLAAAIAADEVAKARAEQALAGLFPEINGIGQVTANKQSANRPLRSKGQPDYYGNNILGAQVSYEIDIWGRVRDLAKAADATAEASAAALANARLELHAELARDYVNLRGIDDEAKLLSNTIGIYRSSLELTQSLLAAKIVSPADVDRAQTQLSSAEAQVSDLALRRVQLEEFDRGFSRKSRARVFDPPLVTAVAAAKAAARSARRCIAPPARRRRAGAAYRGRQSGHRLREGEFVPEIHPAGARRNARHGI